MLRWFLLVKSKIIEILIYVPHSTVHNMAFLPSRRTVNLLNLDLKASTGVHLENLHQSTTADYIITKPRTYYIVQLRMRKTTIIDHLIRVYDRRKCKTSLLMYNTAMIFITVIDLITTRQWKHVQCHSYTLKVGVHSSTLKVVVVVVACVHE